MVLHGNRPELLREVVMHIVRAHPLAPLEDEIILVQSSGIAQWLKLALAAAREAGGCGVAAAVDMQLPSRFVWQAYRTVLGEAHVPETSPLDKSRLLWRLLRLLPRDLARPEFKPLAHFLADDHDLRRHYQLAERIADLFDQYQVYRADWLAAWSREEDVIIDWRQARQALDPAHRWQALLWRAVQDDIGEAQRGGRAAVHQRFLQRLQQIEARPAGLPARVTVFGVTSLPQQVLEVLRGLSRYMQVILCVHNPCEHYWTDLLSERDMVRAASGRHARRSGVPAEIAGDALHLHAHPLLTAWGRQGRDYIALLDEADEPQQYRAFIERAGGRIDVFESPGEGTLLHQLQDDIRALRPVAETRARWPAIDAARERSIEFHVAHSLQREVEILHDQVLDALEADTTLNPRDIVVMVPDVDLYAPHIDAVFGQIDEHDPRYIPHSIADLSQRQRQPLARAIEMLLHVPESRLGASEIFDLLDVPAVRQRLGVSADDAQRIARWVRQAGIRWGLDAAHRARFTGHEHAQNTWRHGLARMLLGYASGEDPTGREASDWHDIEPLGEVAGLEAALVGPLAALLDALEALLHEFAQPATPAVWGERLRAMLERCVLATTADDIALLDRLRDSLVEWVAQCADAQLETALPLAVVRDHWMSQWSQPTLSHRFMAGQLTFATLMPMRAIPFRMVCLLGMSDGQFPRVRAPVDFDLMAQSPRPGDRSRRDDDRYLFLEAVLSARERLHISWVGRSAIDNTVCPPSVLVSQLRDHLDAGWRLVDDAPAAQARSGVAQALTVEHRLQAFGRAYFEGTRLDGGSAGRLFTYAREWERSAAPVLAPVRATVLAPPTLETPITLDQLAAFLRDPITAFYRDRLGVVPPGEADDSDDQEPFALDARSRWALQHELIAARFDALARGDAQETAVACALARMRRRGVLPIGERAGLVEAELVAPLDAMFDDYLALRRTWPEPCDDLSGEHAVVIDAQTVVVRGAVTQRQCGAHGVCRINVASVELIEQRRYRPDKLLRDWVVHLAAHALGAPMTSKLVGKNGTVTLHPLPVAHARATFERLVAAYVEGLRRPLPIAPKTAFVWLQRGGQPVTGTLDGALLLAREKAAQAYEGTEQHRGEVARAVYRQQVYPTFDDLWDAGQFSLWCDRLFKPLLDALAVSGEDA